MTKRCERIRCLAGLAYEEGEAACFQHGVPVAKFAREIQIDRQAGDGLQPLFGDHSSIIAGAARHDRYPFDGGQVKIHLRQRNLLF